MSDTRNSVKFWIVSGAAFAILFAGVGVITIHFVLQSQIDRFAERFSLLSSLRKEALQEYFDTAKAEITFWSLNDELINRHAELVRQEKTSRQIREDDRAALDQQIAMDAIQSKLQALAKTFIATRGYYDFFLISPEGDVMYTVKKESDLDTNLESGPWRDSGLADVYRRAMADKAAGVVMSDFESYLPSAGEPAMFMARRMVDADGTVVGVLALQLPTERINQIMRFTAGMGDSGETYLVGEDLLMRSDSRFSDESTILKTTVDTETVRKSLAGETGTEFTPDYRGIMVLSAYDSTDIDGFRWAVMAEIDEDEVLRTVANKRPMIAGLMFLMYSLSLWSVWYLRQGEAVVDEALAPIDIDADYSDLGA